MINSGVNIPKEKIVDFCCHWKIVKFSLFGSRLTSNFTPNSDIDVLIDFAPNAKWTLFDHVEMREELINLFGRTVDVITRNGIERSKNYIRRKAILNSLEVIYAS